MVKKRGLGKGLQALIPPLKEENQNTLRDISVTDIIPNANQPRKKIDQEKLMELANSIKVHGVIQPIIVSQLDDNQYQLVAGERRWRACQMAGQQTIPAVVTNYTTNVSAEISLIENLQREDLNPLEEALAYQSLIKEFGLTQQELAKRVGKSRSQVANMLRLLILPTEILKMLSNNTLTTGHARALLPIDDQQLQIKMAQEIIKKHLSVRQTEKLVNKLLHKTPNKPVKKPPIDPGLENLTGQLQSLFGTKVLIKSNKTGRGKLEIEFYSEEDLTRIVDIVLSK